MPYIQLSYANYDYWTLYHKVTFDGENKIIQINEGETDIYFPEDIYSAWKEWSRLEDNSKYPAAMRVLGGEPISEQRDLGGTFFLINNWKMRTWSGDHILNIVGNVYTDDAGGLFLPTASSNVNTLINLITSNIIDKIGSPGNTTDNLAASVWNKPVDELDTPDSFGEKMRKNLPK